jgi:hemerythrin superfamily protein
MKTLLKPLAPSATDMIRADHTRVLAIFHRYSLDARPALKRGLVESICLALEIHAQLEEEIFYPAMRDAGSTVVAELEPEHQEMRRRIGLLRQLDPADPQYDQTFMELMRDVIHHVADEETMLLTSAESLLRQRLSELGGRMLKRRMQLGAPRAAEMARNRARSARPGAMLLAAAALLAGAFVFARRTSAAGRAPFSSSQ